MSPPAVPTGLTASAGYGAVTLSWDAATGATGYEIQQWTSITGSWEVLSSSSYTLGSSGRQATVNRLTNGRTYYFRIRSTNSAYQSGWGSWVSAQPTVVLTTPAGLTGTSTSSTISLSWTGVSNALGYEVQQWNPTTRSWDILPVDPYSVSVSGTTAIVRGLSADTTYYHQVRATNGLVRSGWTPWSTIGTSQ